MAGALFVVGTPIGNLEDLTPRAARVLGEVGFVVAEDTRLAAKLMTHLGLSKRLLSYNEHNAAQRTPRILRSLLKEDVALVTDAGAPAVSDPGAALVRAAAEQGTPVVSVPGPSAVTAALAVAGMRADSFRFLGFPPRARKARRSLFRDAGAGTDTLVLFEAPHRVRATLADLAAELGEREVVVCREMTKLYEEVFRGAAAEALAHFTEPRGEFTLVVAGAPYAVRAAADEQGAARAMARLKAEGSTRLEAMAMAIEAYGVSRRDAYRLWLEA